jgi:hypothetical protein
LKQLKFKKFKLIKQNDQQFSEEDAVYSSCGDKSEEIFTKSVKGSRGHHHRHHPSSPNKRHRLTPRPQAIQRPCLDFEKMQQVRYLPINKMIEINFKLKGGKHT